MVRVLVWASVFALAGLLGRSTVIGGETLSLVWPAAGVALLWLCTGSRTTWPADLLVLAAATLAVNLGTGAPLDLSLGLVATNLAQVVLAVAMLRRLTPDLWGFGGTRELGTVRDLGMLVATSALSCLVGAGLGVLVLELTLGTADVDTFLVWWGRNTAGMLVVTVLGLLVLAPLHGAGSAREVAGRMALRLRPTRPLRIVEGLLIVAVTIALALGIFRVGQDRPLGFMLLFTVVLAAVRLRPLAVVLHGILVGGIAVVLTLAGDGPFAALARLEDQALVAQVFVCMVVVTGLLLAFSRTERDLAITSLRKSERELEHRAQLLDSILQNMREGVVVVDEDGAAVLRNPAGRRMLAIPEGSEPAALDRSRYVPRHLDGTPLSDDEMPYRRVLDGEDLVTTDIRIRAPGGAGERILEVTAVPLHPPTPEDPERVMVNYRDVTEDRRHREGLVSFAGVVAHDLYSPLTVVNGWADALDEELEEQGVLTAQEARPMVARVLGAARHMRSFIDDLLSFSLARDSEISMVPVDLSRVGEEIAVMRREQDTRPRISIAPGLRATGDPVLLRQLLDNLISNGVKYVAPGVRPSVAVTGRVLGDELEVTVRDNGIGVPAEAREKIFEDFYRVGTEGYRGTGLGLAICLRVVERHGGRLRVEDNPDGPGSAFVFTLPHLPAPSPGTPDDQQPVPEAGPGQVPAPVDGRAVDQAAGTPRRSSAR